MLSAVILARAVLDTSSRPSGSIPLGLDATSWSNLVVGLDGQRTLATSASTPLKLQKKAKTNVDHMVRFELDFLEIVRHEVRRLADASFKSSDSSPDLGLCTETPTLMKFLPEVAVEGCGPSQARTDGCKDLGGGYQPRTPMWSKCQTGHPREVRQQLAAKGLRTELPSYAKVLVEPGQYEPFQISSRPTSTGGRARA